MIKLFWPDGGTRSLKNYLFPIVVQERVAFCSRLFFGGKLHYYHFSACLRLNRMHQQTFAYAQRASKKLLPDCTL